jgi:choline dehydrogenase
VRANEVILAGGSFNSPQLLQLSGVGPRALLEAHGIPVVHESPGVGEDLQDHFYCRTFWRCNRPITLNDDLMSRRRQAKIGLQYLLFRRGPLTVSAGHAAAFVRARPESRRPDAQIYFINFSTAKRGGVLHPFSGFTLSVSQTQVESRGSVRIASADPHQQPAIRYNYLATENDRRVMVEGLKLIRRIAAAGPLAGYIAAEEFPGARVQSDADWLAFCREAGDTVFHPTSTCRMGTDARAVVDPQLRVRGVEGLRVVDASVMPSVPSGNINAAVIAMAEKAADLAGQKCKV